MLKPYIIFPVKGEGEKERERARRPSQIKREYPSYYIHFLPVYRSRGRRLARLQSWDGSGGHCSTGHSPRVSDR